MFLRKAEPGDALAVASVHVSSWRAGYRGLLPDDYLNALRAEERARRYAFADRSLSASWTTVAVHEGLICGFATTGPARDPDARGSGELLGLYVDPSRWSTGTGRALIVSARRELASRGFHDAIFWVLAGNERAQRFYDRDGWRPDGSARADEIWGVRVSELRYCRELPQATRWVHRRVPYRARRGRHERATAGRTRLGPCRGAIRRRAACDPGAGCEAHPRTVSRSSWRARTGSACRKAPGQAIRFDIERLLPARRAAALRRHGQRLRPGPGRSMPAPMPRLSHLPVRPGNSSAEAGARNPKLGLRNWRPDGSVIYATKVVE
jgi:GNAT superfamily N-acetyltransferase